MTFVLPDLISVGQIVTAAYLNSGRAALSETAPAKAVADGDLFRATGAGAIERLPLGASGELLSVVDGAPAWQTPEPQLEYGYPLEYAGAILAAVPTANATSAAISPDQRYLVVGQTTSPYLNVYRLGGGVVVERLANPATLPTGSGQMGPSIAWSPDSAYFVMGHATSPFVSAYSVSGSTVTKLPNPSPLPGGLVKGVAFTPDGQDVVLTSAFSPFVSAYRWSAGWGTKYADPPGAAAAWPGSFNSEGSLFACGLESTPYVAMWAYTPGSGWGAKAANPGTLPGGQVLATAWAPDDSAVACSELVPAVIRGYEVVGGAFGATGTIGTATGQARSLFYDPLGRYVIMSSQSSPHVQAFALGANAYNGVGELIRPLTTISVGIVYGIDVRGRDVFIAGQSAPYLQHYKLSPTGVTL